jgi:hypothetical protein
MKSRNLFFATSFRINTKSFEEKRLLRIPRRRWEDNIRMDLRETG